MLTDEEKEFYEQIFQIERRGFRKGFLAGFLIAAAIVALIFLIL